MTVDKRTQADRKTNRHLIEALVGYAGFCAISFLSLSVPLALPLMVLSGIALPLAWGRMTGNWESLGFTRRNLGSTIRWGLAAGLATSLIGFVTLQERSVPPNLGLELAVGIPLWLLLASPFQEFFFRWDPVCFHGGRELYRANALS